MISTTLWWLIGAAILGIFELVLTTFYMLVLAAASLVAAIASAVGLTLEWQLAVFSLCAIVGAMLVRAMRRKSLTSDQESDALQKLDAGQIVDVASVDDNRRTRVFYRGAEWPAQLTEHSQTGPGSYQIVEIAGSVLMLEKL